jgi:hypothetical protein
LSGPPRGDELTHPVEDGGGWISWSCHDVLSWMCLILIRHKHISKLASPMSLSIDHGTLLWLIRDVNLVSDNLVLCFLFFGDQSLVLNIRVIKLMVEMIGLLVLD